MDRDKELLAGLTPEDLEDFKAIQTHRGWLAFWGVVEAFHSSEREKTFGFSNQQDAWDQILRVGAIEDIIDLRAHILNRGKVESDNAERERERERGLSGHPESGIPGWASGFRRGRERTSGGG